MFTEIERKVLDYLTTVEHGAWLKARQIADHSGVFLHLTNRSKAGAMTAVLKRLHEHGHVEMDHSEPPILWRLRKK